MYVASTEGVGVTIPEDTSDQEADVISPIKQSTASAQCVSGPRQLIGYNNPRQLSGYSGRPR